MFALLLLASLYGSQLHAKKDAHMGHHSFVPGAEDIDITQFASMHSEFNDDPEGSPFRVFMSQSQADDVCDGPMEEALESELKLRAKLEKNLDRLDEKIAHKLALIEEMLRQLAELEEAEENQDTGGLQGLWDHINTFGHMVLSQLGLIADEVQTGDKAGEQLQRGVSLIDDELRDAFDGRQYPPQEGEATVSKRRKNTKSTQTESEEGESDEDEGDKTKSTPKGKKTKKTRNTRTQSTQTKSEEVPCSDSESVSIDDLGRVSIEDCDSIDLTSVPVDDDGEKDIAPEPAEQIMNVQIQVLKMDNEAKAKEDKDG